MRAFPRCASFNLLSVSHLYKIHLFNYLYFVISRKKNHPNDQAMSLWTRTWEGIYEMTLETGCTFSDEPITTTKSTTCLSSFNALSNSSGNFWPKKIMSKMSQKTKIKSWYQINKVNVYSSYLSISISISI